MGQTELMEEMEPTQRMFPLHPLLPGLQDHKVNVAREVLTVLQERAVLQIHAGSSGATGAAGATGPAGSGSTGAQGPSGSSGTNGTNGSAGGTGLTGARGETGTVGPSEVTVGTLIFSNISGAVGSSSASTLSGLKAGKSYLIRFFIHTYYPSDRFLSTAMILNLTAVATSGSPVITKQYIQASGNTYRNGAEGYEWSLVGQLVVNGALVPDDFGLTITITAGKSTASTALKIECDFTSTLVGAVL